jgi:hypothetical protein
LSTHRLCGRFSPLPAAVPAALRRSRQPHSRSAAGGQTADSGASAGGCGPRSAA